MTFVDNLKNNYNNNKIYNSKLPPRFMALNKIPTVSSSSSNTKNNAIQFILNAQKRLLNNNTSSNTLALNNTLFVGNLHASLQEIDLIQVFQPFGHIIECCKKWLHFGFIKFSHDEEACRAYFTLNGYKLKGRPIRLEFQNRTKKINMGHLNHFSFQAHNSKSVIFQSPLNILLNSTRKAKPFITSTSQQNKFFDLEKLLQFAIGNENENEAFKLNEKNLPSHVEQAWNSVEIKSNSRSEAGNVKNEEIKIDDDDDDDIDKCWNFSNVNDVKYNTDTATKCILKPFSIYDF